MSELHGGMILGAVLMLFAAICVGGFWILCQDGHVCQDLEDGDGE